MYSKSSKRGRTLEDRITDKFLLLYLIDDVESGVGDTKLQKLAFLSELDMILQGRKGFNYNFFKMPFGPYSGELKKDVADLTKCGIITHLSHASTRRGQKILEAFNHLLENNSDIISKIQGVNKFHAHLERDFLVDKVHEMPNPMRPSISIDKTKHGTYLLKRMKLAFIDRIFQISESDIASLEIVFDPEYMGSLVSSLQEAKTTPSAKFSDVLEIV